MMATVLWCAWPGQRLNMSPKPAVNAEEMQRRWIKRAASSQSKSQALTNLFRAVQPQKVRPPVCMVVDGLQATRAASHEGWRKRLVEEKAWSADLPQDVEEHVQLKLRELLRSAGQKAEQERFDISFEEVVSELAGWGTSSALPSEACKLLSSSWLRAASRKLASSQACGGKFARILSSSARALSAPLAPGRRLSAP